MADRQAANIEAWLHEVDDEDNNYQAESSSDEEIDHLEEQNHESESEQEQDVIEGEEPDESFEDDGPPQQRRRTDFYIGVDNTLWSKTTPLNRGRTRRHNIVFVPPGPKGIAELKLKLH